MPALLSRASSGVAPDATAGSAHCGRAPTFQPERERHRTRADNFLGHMNADDRELTISVLIIGVVCVVLAFVSWSLLLE